MLSLQCFLDTGVDNPHREVREKRHAEHLICSVLNGIRIVMKINTLKFLVWARGVPFCHVQQPNLVRPLLRQVIKSLVFVVLELVYFSSRAVQFIKFDGYAIC